MKFTVLTLFPEMFSALDASIVGRAKREGTIGLNVVNIRDYSEDKRRRADDTPFGGGPGMILTPQPLFSALGAVDARGKRVVYMSPRGRVLDEEILQDLSRESELVVVCGHYEGIDERVLTEWGIEELSIGDYVLTGGELPCMVLIDALTRLLPGVLASEDAAYGESIYSGLLEYPQYTQPRVFQGLSVPEILLSGDHRKIDLWRFEQALILTKKRRPDLFERFVKNRRHLDKDEQKIVEKVLDMM